MALASDWNLNFLETSWYERLRMKTPGSKALVHRCQFRVLLKRKRPDGSGPNGNSPFGLLRAPNGFRDLGRAEVEPSVFHSNFDIGSLDDLALDQTFRQLVLDELLDRTL